MRSISSRPRYVPLGSWNTASSWKISSIAARRRTESISPNTSWRFRSNKVDAVWDITSLEWRRWRRRPSLPPELTDARHTAFRIRARHTNQIRVGLADEWTVRDDRHILPLARV